MRVLVVNDDGYKSEGLEVLRQILISTGQFEVWTCAPESNNSGVSRSLAVNEDIRVRSLGDKFYTITSTPTTCVSFSLAVLMENKPDLILSGINLGSNVGEEVAYSGTVAGAMEGRIWGIPSIAFSQVLKCGMDNARLWDVAREFAMKIIYLLLDFMRTRDFDRVSFAVNLPCCTVDQVTRIAFTTQVQRNIIERCYKKYDTNDSYYRVSGYIPDGEISGNIEDTDLYCLEHNGISLLPLNLDWTYYGVHRDLNNNKWVQDTLQSFIKA